MLYALQGIMTSPSLPHTPILVDEFLSFFKDMKLKVFIDATLGAGGHSLALLKTHPELELLIGLDQDPLALEIASNRLSPFASKIQLIRGNFRHIKILSPCASVDGIFADLGVSSMQLDRGERGLSFSKEGPLDMRMDPSLPLTAEEIINHWSQDQLETIFREYAEEKRWRLVAKIVIEERKKQPIKTTLDLVKILKPILPYNPKKQINPCTLVFQGLRIAVNHELEALEEFLPAAIDLLAPSARLGLLSFHSLEDRIAKNYFRKVSGYKGGKEHSYDPDKEEKPQVRLLTKKPISPSDEEIALNPRSRSAKMRFVEKL